MVPEGWKIKSLGEICDGNLQTGPFGSQLHANEYTASGTPVLMPKDFVDGKVNLSGAAKISHNRASDLSKHKLQTGDLLFSRRGDVTRFALITEDVAGALCGTGCLRARPSSKHTPLFLAYFLQKNAVQKWLEQNAVGQTMPNMNTAILSELPLMVSTNTAEEEEIARILSTWDKAIETVEKLIENSQAQKKALMQQLLTGKRRLPGFDGRWKETAIKNMGKIISGGTPDTNTNEFWKGDILWMTPTDVTALKSRFISDTKRKITKSGVENSSATLLPKGSLLVCTRATVGLMSISTSEITTNQGFKSIIPNAKHDVNFLYY